MHKVLKKKGGEGGHYSSFYMLYQEKLALLQNAVHQFNQGKEVLSKIYQKKSWLTWSNKFFTKRKVVIILKDSHIY